MNIEPGKIKRIRKNLGLNADAFGELVGLKGKHRARTIFAWEKGDLVPSKSNQEKIRECAVP